MLENIAQIITNLQNTNSQSEKIKILSANVTNNEFKKFLTYCYGQQYLFGVTSKSLKEHPDLSEFEIYDSIFDLCDLLVSKQITGNRAIAVVNGYINGNLQYEELLYNFFDKNLKIGVNVTQINKALGNIIPVFDVALASTFDEAKKDSYGLEHYFIERKLNGLRLITIIQYNNGEPSFKFLSRKGKEFTTMGKIEEELKEVYKNSLYFGSDIVLDGEVCIINPDGKEDWNRAVSEAKRKDYTIYNPMYVCFDLLTLDEFYGFKQSMKYYLRYNNLKKLLNNNGIKLQHETVVFAVPYNEDHFNKLLKEFVETEKWEGFIFRKNAIFKSGRSTDLIKYKLFKDAEFRVIGIEESIKPMLNNKGLMEDTKCVGSLIVEYKNNKVNIGSGLTDEQRINWLKNPMEIVGKQILVKYKEETKNQDGTVSLQFPILKHVFEEDRDF